MFIVHYLSLCSLSMIKNIIYVTFRMNNLRAFQAQINYSIIIVRLRVSRFLILSKFLIEAEISYKLPIISFNSRSHAKQYVAISYG